MAPRIVGKTVLISDKRRRLFSTENRDCNLVAGAPSVQGMRATSVHAAVCLCAMMSLTRVAALPVNCPALMYAAPESGQYSFNDCICRGGAVTRDWEAENCTHYVLKMDKGCSQNTLTWVELGPASSPAICMHLVMDNNGTQCKDRTFFLWKDRGGDVCYCPGGTPAAVDQCDYSKFSLLLMGASTYSIQTPSSITAEVGGHSTSCFASNLSLCELCPAGTFTNESDSIYNTVNCTKCPMGTYSQIVGANASTLCTPCGAGSYSESTGQASVESCVQCVAGKFSALAVASSRSRCISCAAGLYSEEDGGNSSETCMQVRVPQSLSKLQKHTPPAGHPATPRGVI